MARIVVVGRSRRSARVGTAVGLMLASYFGGAAYAEVITGAMTGVPLDADFRNSGVFGDGTNNVQFIAIFGWWSVSHASGGMWFNGSDFNFDDGSLVKSEVAFVPDVLDVSLITDASAYSFTTSGLASTVAVAGGPQLFDSLSGLVLLRNEATGHYGALRLDGMSAQPFAFDADSIDITWWFQTDGSGDFSSVPAPGPASLIALSALVVSRRRR